MPNALSTKKGNLPADRHEEFIADVRAGMKDAELALKYELRERTATNWRLKAEKRIASEGGSQQ